MASDRARDLLFPITILISVAVGTVIGGSFARSGTDNRPLISATSTDSKALVDAIDSMRAELARTREQLALTSSPASSSSLADTRSVAPDTISEMRKVTARLIEAADTLHSAASHAGGDRVPLVAPATVDPKVFQVVLSQENEINSKTYLLWTYQQVMDRFGTPDAAGHEDAGAWWIYAQGSSSVLFHFTDGRVSSVDSSK